MLLTLQNNPAVKIQFFNVGVGYDALTAVTRGKDNVGIGYKAGNTLHLNGNNNIVIGS